MTAMLSGAHRAAGSVPSSGPARSSTRSSTQEWVGTFPGMQARRTPDELFSGFQEDYPAVSREMFDRLFNEGGALIILPAPNGTVYDPEARAKLCATREEARAFVKGYKAKDAAWFVWSDLFL